jgi:CelD/BcsL family acetyltransferase involved in cellulose biosynthesis
MTNAVLILDPLTDRRWPEFLARHPEASVFHSPEWLHALRDSYGYDPIVFTTSKEGPLENGVVFCHIRSWITGNRLVSVPFSDHCQPLATSQELNLILQVVSEYRRQCGYKYSEIRPRSAQEAWSEASIFATNEKFTLHNIDLRADAATIYRNFHESCIRRKIKRAEKEKLTLESGNSEELLHKFRHLLLLTRRRHKLPPQPAKWFSNLARCLGKNLKIYLVSKDGIPAASIFTISYNKTLMYKYGCSDAQFHNLGGMPLLFWKAIQEGKQAGMECFDLGRSSAEDPGLLAFKGHLGGIASSLTYYRDTPSSRAIEAPDQPRMQWARNTLARLPEPLLVGAGNLLYRHFA